MDCDRPRRRAAGVRPGGVRPGTLGVALRRAPSLEGLLLKIAVTVVGVEVAITVLPAWLQSGGLGAQHAALHSALVTLCCGVVLYYWVLRPLEIHLVALHLDCEAAQSAAEHLTRVDALTGMANRRVFFEELEREWDRSTRYGTPLACIVVDLDLFRQLNGAHGHLAGDTALRKFGQLLRSMCRSSDVICRFGGQEFCLPETTEQEAVEFAERIREAISEQPIEFDSRCLHVTASCGVAQRDPQMTLADGLMEAASRALIHSKQQGRDRVTAASALASVSAVVPRIA
jgi:diguanylate cyclase (GGDEF)-like protein